MVSCSSSELNGELVDGTFRGISGSSKHSGLVWPIYCNNCVKIHINTFLFSDLQNFHHLLTSSKLSKSPAEFSTVGNTCGGRCLIVCCGGELGIYEVNVLSSICFLFDKFFNSHRSSSSSTKTIITINVTFKPLVRSQCRTHRRLVALACRTAPKHPSRISRSTYAVKFALATTRWSNRRSHRLRAPPTLVIPTTI